MDKEARRALLVAKSLLPERPVEAHPAFSRPFVRRDVLAPDDDKYRGPSDSRLKVWANRPDPITRADHILNGNTVTTPDDEVLQFPTREHAVNYIDSMVGHWPRYAKGGSAERSALMIAKNVAGGKAGKDKFLEGNHPIVPEHMYHGAGEHFKVFDRSRLGENTGADDAGIGFHFSDNVADAGFYADKAAERLGKDRGVVGKYHLSIKNPLIVGMDESHGNAGHRTQEFLDDKIAAKRYADAHGHDAIIYPHGTNVDSGYTAVVFHPEQIKSATDNNGDFNPTDPDITKARGGSIHPATQIPGVHISERTHGKPIFTEERIGKEGGGSLTGKDEDGEDGIFAYHSSPHDIGPEGFSNDKIGTGEGAQVYGHGHYFAEHPAVSGQGGQYWNNFYHKMPRGVEKRAASVLESARFDRNAAIALSEKLRDEHLESAANGPEEDKEGHRLLAEDRNSAAEYLRSGKIAGPRTYEVRIQGRPEHFLDWDAPIDEQSPHVIQALEKADWWPYAREGADELADRHGQNAAGSDIMRWLHDDWTKPEASQMLSDLGIRGIRFLDQGSRPEGKGTRNYVVFDPKHIDIQRRYARGGMAYADGGSTPDDGVQKALDLTRDLNPQGLYSHAAEAAMASPQAKGPLPQMLASLKGVKPDEMKYSGVEQAFADQPQVTREQLAQHFTKNIPELKQTVLRPGGGNKGQPKYQAYTLPGGENYREVLLHRPVRPQEDVVNDIMNFHREMNGIYGPRWGQEGNPLSPEHQDEYDRLEDALASQRDEYSHPHWSVPNVVGHYRVKDRTGPNGEKIMHVEEVQSDWAQQARATKKKRGVAYYDPAKPYQVYDPSTGKVVSQHATPEEAMAEEERHNIDAASAGTEKYLSTNHAKMLNIPPAGPFVSSTDNATDLILKHILTEAARGNYDKVVFTPGDEQVKRWNEPGLKPYYDETLPKRLNDLVKQHDPDAKVEAHNVPMPEPFKKPKHSERVAYEERAGGELSDDQYEALYDYIWDNYKSDQFNRGAHFNPLRMQIPEDIWEAGLKQAMRLPGIEPSEKKKGLPGLAITPRLREGINKRGFKAYARGGDVEGTMRIGKAVGGTLGSPEAIQKALSLTNPVAGGPQLPPQEVADMADMLGRVRSTQTGRQVGRYQNVPPKSALWSMVNDLHSLAKEGSPGRRWYEKSSRRILQHFGGDKDAADKFAQLIAIYSPQTTVPVNTGHAIKAYNRAKAGHPLWNGDIVDRDKTFDTAKDAADYVQSLGGSGAGITRVPLDDSGRRFLIARHRPGGYENIATADRDLKAHLLMNEGVAFEGRKTNNFYNNLMVHIDPRRLQGSTQDLWMAHAFGFPDTGIGSGEKYTFMENLTRHLANELGWRPHQVQAAIWTAIKARMEGTADEAKKQAVAQGLATMVPGVKGKSKFVPNDGAEDQIAELHRDIALGQKRNRTQILSSARDFSDFLDQNLANVSWESAPSKKIAHLNGIEDLPDAAKAEYHGLMSKALQDNKGNDLLAKYLGIMSPGSVDAPGYWEGKTNPATQLLVGATRAKGALQAPDIDPASKDLLELYAAGKGLLHKQDGVGYHRPFYNPQVTQANGAEFQFDKDLTPDHIRDLGLAMDAHLPGSAIIPVNSKTVRVLNFRGPQRELKGPDGKAVFDEGGEKDPVPEGHSFEKIHPFGPGVDWKDQRGFHKAASDVVSAAVPNTHRADMRVFASDGNLLENHWGNNPNGDSYIQRISAAGRPDVLHFISSVLAPKVEDIDRAFAQKYGLKTDPAAEAAVRNAHTYGQRASQRGVAPAPAVGGGNLPASNSNTGEPPSEPRMASGGFAVSKHQPNHPIVDDALRLTSRYGQMLPDAVNLARQHTRGRP